MIVLAISAIITVLAFQSTKTERQVSVLNSVEFSARIIGKAMDGYYLNHCLDTTFPQPSLSVLVTDYIKRQSFIEPPIDITFVPTIAGIGSGDVMYLVTANMPDITTAEWFALKSQNVVVSGLQVQWLFRPELSANGKSTRMQQLRSAYGNQQC